MKELKYEEISSKIKNFGKKTHVYWCCALAGEIGELCNLFKKRERDGKELLNEIGEEMADIFIYIVLSARFFSIKLDLDVISFQDYILGKPDHERLCKDLSFLGCYLSREMGTISDFIILRESRIMYWERWREEVEKRLINIFYLLKIASMIFNIDLEKAIMDKIEIVKKRRSHDAF